MLASTSHHTSHGVASKHNQQFASDEENVALPFKLTISEYEEVAARHEASLKSLELVRSALDTIENSRALADRVGRECDQMTLRIQVGKFEKTRTSPSKPGIQTDIYRCQLTDITQKAFVVLKHPKSAPMKFVAGDKYLVDKVKLMINKLGEVVLISTSMTVLRVETEETHTIESMELSQKQYTHRQQQQLEQQNEHDRDYFQNVTNQTNSMLARDDMQLEQSKSNGHFGASTSGHITYQQAQAAPTNYIVTDPETDEPPMFNSTKQIKEQSEVSLQDWCGPEQEAPRCWSFKELLSWKIPEHLLSTSARQSQERLRRKQAETGYICSYVNNSHLFQYDLVTQRVKEQRVAFVGIVMHVKQFVDKNLKDQAGNGGTHLVTSHIDLESTDDKSKVALFVKHSSRIDLKATLKRGMILLVKDATRKISISIDIYVQLMFSCANFKIIGQVKDQMADFQANNMIQLIKTIPTDQIIRHVIKVLGFITDIQFIKIQYKCEVCRADISSETICRNGCIIKNPQLLIQVLCLVQDGTAKASLELKNERCLQAFRVTEENQRQFKDYCLRHGTFMSPSQAHNPQFREVLSVFKKFETWQQMIFYCKPYAKAANEKRNQQQSMMGGAGGDGYSNTISKPSFVIKDKEKEVFLNGELQVQKKTMGYGEQGRIMKKTALCLKGLSVETELNPESVRNTYCLINAVKGVSVAE